MNTAKLQLDSPKRAQLSHLARSDREGFEYAYGRAPLTTESYEVIQRRREHVREANDTLAGDKSISREDPMRTDGVHAKVSRQTASKAGIALENPRASKHYTGRAGAAQFDDEADSLDMRFAEQVEALPDIRAQAGLKLQEARDLALTGNDVASNEAFAHARELRALAANTARRLVQQHIFFGDCLAEALKKDDLASAERQLLEAISSQYADHALKVAAVRGLEELQALRPVGEAAEITGPWLAERAKIELRTAQRLLQDAHRIESGVAALLTGTKWGERALLQELLDEETDRRSAVIAQVRACLTRHVLEHNISKQKRQWKLAEPHLTALDAIGLNIREVREWITSTMSPEEATQWIAHKLDEAVAHAGGSSVVWRKRKDHEPWDASVERQKRLLKEGVRGLRAKGTSVAANKKVA